MTDYEKLYRIVFNGITDALEALEREDYGSARKMLIKAQQAAEDCYIEECNDGDEHLPVYILPYDAFADM